MVFPNGESVRDFHRRADAAFAALAAHPARRLAAVTHGGVLMRILSHLHGAPAARQFEFLPPRGALTTLERQGDAWHVKS
jgi:broad specificity phosphatase PhoE